MVDCVGSSVTGNTLGANVHLPSMSFALRGSSAPVTAFLAGSAAVCLITVTCSVRKCYLLGQDVSVSNNMFARDFSSFFFPLRQ